MKSITLSSGREFKIASLTVAQTRELFFSGDGSLKTSEQQMDAAFIVLAASLNNANYKTLPWYRKLFQLRVTPHKLENTLNLAEFRELQTAVIELSGLARGGQEGEAPAAR
jgi:hypothetical protein